MTAYYNECDRLKSEVLREAIKAGAIAPGDVDDRSIVDVRGSDLRGYSQCHFFAGGGFWSLALRNAGWPDDRSAWTGSCPCPSFSAAGKGGGFDDPRHLWPDWARLIRECVPPVVFGEQADDAVGYGWCDLVQTDLEAQAYAVGKIVFGAHSVGGPHIRQRLYFCADTDGEQKHAAAEGRLHAESGECCDTGESTDTDGGQSSDRDVQRSGEQRLLAQDRGTGIDRNPSQRGIQSFQPRLEGLSGNEREWREPGWLTPDQARSAAASGATRGFWRDCDWWYGRDGKYRPIGPGLQPLAHGSPARVGRLRMYGDGIVVPQATEFIKAYCEARGLA